jgi:hypothetical protein
MSQLDALRLTERLRARLVSLASAEARTSDSQLNPLLRALWEGPPEDGGLVGDVWVEGWPRWQPRGAPTPIWSSR